MDYIMFSSLSDEIPLPKLTGYGQNNQNALLMYY